MRMALFKKCDTFFQHKNSFKFISFHIKASASMSGFTSFSMERKKYFN